MQQDDASPKALNCNHLLYAVVITIVAIIAGYKGVLPVFRSHLMQYLGIGDDRFGLLFSIGTIPSMIAGLFGGQLLDRWGSRRIIRICLMGIGSAMLIIALAGNHFVLFAIAIGVSGTFTGPLFISISAYLAKLFPRHQRRVISLNLASSSLGGMMFPMAVEGLLYLTRRHESITIAHVLHIPFFLTSILMFSASFIYRGKSVSASHTICKSTHARTPRRRWHWRDLLLPRRALLLAFLISLHGTADTTIFYWMPRFLESESFDRQIVAPGMVLSGFALVYLLSRIILAALPDRVGRRAFLVLPGLAGGSILIAGILSRNYMLTAFGYVLGAFCWSVEYPTMVSMLVRHDKKRFGAAMAASGIFAGLMLFTGMNLMGMFIERLGAAQMWKAMIVPAAWFLLVGLGGLLWVILYDRQPAELLTVSQDATNA